MKAHTANRRLTYGSKVLVCLALMACRAAWADTFSFTDLPPDVAGPAGSSVGWGYTITNESSTSWLVLTALSAGVFDHGSPDSLFDFPSLAPDTTVSVNFDPANLAGLYDLTWEATAPIGFVNAGFFTLQGEWWDGDPLAGGNFISDAPDEVAAYSATVTGSTSVPEPSTITLLTLFLTLIWFRSMRLRADSPGYGSRSAITDRECPCGQSRSNTKQ